MTGRSRGLSIERFAALRDAIHAASFAPLASDGRAVGVEVELLAHDAGTGVPIPLHDASQDSGGLVPAIRRIGARLGWSEFAAYDGTARFDVLGQALISFEPGGQIEVSSAPSDTVTGVVSVLRDIVASLRSGLLDDGIALRSVGIDPSRDAMTIPMQLPVARYQMMTDYFNRIGPFGIRMMRQTAAMQVSVDRGRDPAARWRLLNDLAPYIIAIFANSPIYSGVDTDHRSFRANCWRRLDSTRTGVADGSDDPASAYARFALRANDMMRTDDRANYHPYEHWLAQEADDAARWSSHLTTLFPEVRPRGHYEVRSCDAVAPEWYAAPILFITGLAYDAQSSREASILAADSRALLRVAGERGMRDTDIARTSRDLFQLALDGARRLGENYMSSDVVDVARDFYATYTARDRSPADDALASIESPALSRPIRSPI